MRRKHFALSTERTYCYWIGRYYAYLKATVLPQHCPPEKKAEMFLTWLAVKEEVAASTQNQAFSALLFLYGEVLQKPLEDVDSLRARRPVYERDSIPQEQLLPALRDIADSPQVPARLILLLIYGSGLRISEALNLRIKDVCLLREKLTIREPKHGHDRCVGIPKLLVKALRHQMERARDVWQIDCRENIGVPVPGGLHRKYPHLYLKWQWAWVFPAAGRCAHPRFEQNGRHPETVRYRVHEASIQRALRRAASKHGLDGRLTPHVLRHCYGTHFSGDIQVLQKLLGHRQIDTTMGYRHPEIDAESPLDEAAVLAAADCVMRVKAARLGSSSSKGRTYLLK